jgi:hypothetical protein
VRTPFSYEPHVTRVRRCRHGQGPIERGRQRRAHAHAILLSLRKCGPEHRQTASRLGFGRFILQNIPVFREHAVGHSDEIGGDPISGPSSSRKPAMDDHEKSGPARTSATLGDSYGSNYLVQLRSPSECPLVAPSGRQHPLSVRSALGSRADVRSHQQAHPLLTQADLDGAPRRQVWSANSDCSHRSCVHARANAGGIRRISRGERRGNR